MNANESSCGACKSGPYILIAILSVLVIVLGVIVLNNRKQDLDRPTNESTAAAKIDASTEDGFAAHGHLGPSLFAEYDPVTEAKKALDAGDLIEAEKQLEFARLGDENDRVWAQGVSEEISLAKSDEHAKTYLAGLDDKQLRFLVAVTTSHKAVHEFIETLPETDDLRKNFEKLDNHDNEPDFLPGRDFFSHAATSNAFNANLRKYLPDLMKERKLDQPDSKPAAPAVSSETATEPEKKDADTETKDKVEAPKTEPKKDPAPE